MPRHILLLIALAGALTACSTPQRMDMPSTTAGTPSTEAPLSAPSRPSATTDTSPTVLAMMQRADQAYREGRLDVAEMTLERALRIEPHNPVLWSNLASLRMQQGRVADAAELALKSNRLAADDRRLRRHNLQLLHEAYTQLGRATKAEAVARELQQMRP